MDIVSSYPYFVFQLIKKKKKDHLLSELEISLRILNYNWLSTTNFVLKKTLYLFYLTLRSGGLVKHRDFSHLQGNFNTHAELRNTTIF